MGPSVSDVYVNPEGTRELTACVPRIVSMTIYTTLSTRSALVWTFSMFPAQNETLLVIHTRSKLLLHSMEREMVVYEVAVITRTLL